MIAKRVIGGVLPLDDKAELTMLRSPMPSRPAHEYSRTHRPQVGRRGAFPAGAAASWLRLAPHCFAVSVATGISRAFRAGCGERWPLPVHDLRCSWLAWCSASDGRPREGR